MIDPNTVLRIRETANIVEVVSEFVTLKKRGVNYTGLCPFHSEKTPSFSVSPAKGICKCFSCGKGGDSVRFLMDLEQMSYVEALRWLARKYNIEVEERELTPEQRAKQNKREGLFVLNDWARQYFCDLLWEHADGRTVGLAYFRSRGFRDDIIKKFERGYSLSERETMTQTALSKGYSREALVETGLSIMNDQGELRDRYRGRVIFPVHSVSGKIVAFGGRVLGNAERTAKYVNSPESEIYHKGRELYGIYLAKQSIVRYDCCYLVEGYTDVISMHQCGIENVVASSGTALTDGQITMIHRLTNNVTILYDGDAAGIKASLRGIDMLLTHGLNIKILLLPDGDDPDSFSRKHTAEEFMNYIEANAQNFVQFKTTLLQAEAGSDPVKRAALVQDVVHTIALVPDAVQRYEYIRICRDLLRMDEALLSSEVAKAVRSTGTKPAPYNPSSDVSVNAKPIMGASTHTITNPSLEASSLMRGDSHVLAPTLNTVSTLNMIQAEHQQHAEERLIMQQVVRHGEEVIGQVENEEGHMAPMTVLEYVYHSLEMDNIQFQNTTYTAMLLEAMAHIHEEGFATSRFFMHHINPEFNRIALDLAVEEHTLSAYHSKLQTIKTERENAALIIQHLMLDLKFSIVKAQHEALMQQINTPEVLANVERLDALMLQLRDTLEVKKAIAEQLNRVVIK
ncbi:MAG: DNA primase [Bacteroidales bacterium]|nr:DNA primase [Bacteroidales bacterium]